MSGGPLHCVLQPPDQTRSVVMVRLECGMVCVPGGPPRKKPAQSPGAKAGCPLGVFEGGAFGLK
eukprot:15342237-Ditylum_brightwellii.AAC.1